MNRNRLIKELASRLGAEVRVHPGKRRVQVMRTRGIDCFLDVGAARGQTGLELRRFGYAGRILSFEPLVAPYAALRACASRDPAWETSNVALAARDGEAVIHMSENSDSSSLLPVTPRSVQGERATRTVSSATIQTVTLDRISRESLRGEEKICLKLDVQGYELEVLTGAEATLSRISIVQAELSFVELYAGAPRAETVIKRLNDHGFRLAGIEPGFLDPSTGEQLQADALFFRD